MSVIKQINYNEHLKVLLGPQNHAKLPAIQVVKAQRKRPRVTRFAKPESAERGVRNNGIHTAPSSDNPSIRQEFVTSAYRFGHAQIDDLMKMANSNLAGTGNIQMKENFFDPNAVFQNGPGGCLRGAMVQKTNTVSGKYADSTQHNLFKPNNFEHGVDLLSINLARGREHGVGTYKAVRDFCMNHPQLSKLYNGTPKMMSGFDDVADMYESFDDIDLYVGLLMEQHMNGAQVGPTAGCIISEQFIALKKGDRFWIENHGILSNTQLSEVKSTTLAKVMCATLENTSKVNEMAFINANVNFNGKKNNQVNCDRLGDIDFSAWRHSDSQPAPPAPEPTTPTGDDDEPEKPKPEPVNPPGDGGQINHAEVACQLTDRRLKLIKCGGKNNPWNDDHLDSLIDWMKAKNGFPRRGKRTVIMNQPQGSVLRVSFADNNIKDKTKLATILKHLNNLIELDLSNTQMNHEFKPNEFSSNGRLGNINLSGTSGACWSSELVEMLQSNMKRNMKLFKHNLVFAN